ncbi:MAG: phosphatidate cytidylyltransferase [Anaerolineaceae bacterium]|nr:phosphatidate cytidylyltransferase [Anaerolineaceae bacterium]
MIGNNWIALIITFAASIIWLRINDYFAHKGWISTRLSRKIIHIGTGPIFVLCWLLFDSADSARFLAALVPLGITIQFGLVGTGIIKDQAAVDAMSRTGDPREILKGPLYYGIVFVVLTLIFWNETPTGIVALMIMCGGDGLADIIGKKYGRAKLPWSRRKSFAGSFGVFAGGIILTILIFSIYISAAKFQGPLTRYGPAILGIAFVSTMVESIPVRDIDNISVPLIAVILGMLLF